MSCGELSRVVAELKAKGEPALLAEAVPYARFVGLGVILRDGELQGVLRYSPMLIGNPLLPALHGGSVGALLESTAIFRLLWEHPTDRLPKTINLNVSYLRSAGPRDTFARARINRQGRRVASVRIEAWQQDPSQLIAAADGHFLLAEAAARTRTAAP